MSKFIIGVVVGWTLGSTVMWAYFVVSGLIRTKDEWIAAKRRKSQGSEPK